MKYCKHGHPRIKSNTIIKCGRRHCRSCERVFTNRYKIKVKNEVLSHYGKDGKLKCCWDGCEINDIDMLSLDHINNDGYKQRKKTGYGQGGGAFIYFHVRKLGFPPGYQTLCFNHQMKKEVLKRQKERLDEDWNGLS